MRKENKLSSLEALLHKGQVFTDPASLITYELDAGLDRGAPEGLVFPQSAADVEQIVRWAAQQHIPLVARGAGTGLSGGAVAERGGIVIEFSRMNAVLDFDESGRSALLEPGVVNLAFDERVRSQGLYFPPDPASQRASTIGGNVAENSGGPHCFKYGVTSNYVTGLDVVLADGRSLRIGGRALDYPAYDLCGLLTGSEGTLAIITAVSVRLVRNPPAVKTMMAAFDSLEQAGAAVSAIIAAGLVPATMEMMDRNIIRIVEAYVHAGLPVDAGAVLIIDVDGYPASLDPQIDEVIHHLQAHGGHDQHIAVNAEERDKIWYARKSAAGALSRLAPSYYLVDITVPRSLLAETLAGVNSICVRYGLRAGHVFHAGDGNLHPLILIMDPSDRQLVEKVHHAGREIVELGIRKDGSISGEHGIGIEKRQYMSLMFSDDELAAMWDVKQVFDPGGLFNPSKIFPSSVDRVSTRSEPVGPDLSWPPPMYRPQEAYHIPGAVFTPSTPSEAAQGLSALAATGRPVRISGSIEASPLDGQPGEKNDVWLCTGELKGIKVFSPADLYVTVGSGTSLTELQSFLASERVQVPLAAPWPGASIGGLVAANVNAPLRMRYGSLRDLVLCATVVLGDGRVIRAGRPVIKNVAGYDLVKVFVGSHGTLGLITDVTLKLTPLPRARRTLLAPLDNLERGLALAEQARRMALVASAILLCKDCDIPALRALEGNSHPVGARAVKSGGEGLYGRPLSVPVGEGLYGRPPGSYVLAYTAEGLPEDVQAELDQVRQVLRTAAVPAPVEVDQVSGTDIWARLLENSSGRALQVRVGVPARDLASYIKTQSAALNDTAFIADIGSGLVYAVSEHREPTAAQHWLDSLRRPALALGGYAVAIDMPGTWQDTIDRWGYQPAALDLMHNLKARWDPGDILNPGAFFRVSR
jgi:glycolate oxidase subunit GlcD